MNAQEAQRRVLTGDLISHTDWRGEQIFVKQNKQGRTYYWAGAGSEGFVSCTTVIGRIYGLPFPAVAAAAGEHARDRGVEVHEAIKLMCGGVEGKTLNWRSLDPEVAPRVEMFAQWLSDSEWKPVHVERAFLSKRYGFACTPDQVGQMPWSERLWVLDVKPATAKTVGLQTAAQALAVKESLGLSYSVGRMVVHIGADKLRDVELDKPKTDRDAFLSALHSYRYGTDRKLFV